MGGIRKGATVVAVLALAATGFGAAQPAKADPIPPNITGNPTPGTDLFAQSVRLLTGGTERICGTSPLGIKVHCAEHLLFQPALVAASGTTFGHWVFCHDVCTPRLMIHEMVHVRQFEKYGDIFGPMYLAEAAVHGTGCDNKWERPAYQANGDC